MLLILCVFVLCLSWSHWDCPAVSLLLVQGGGTLSKCLQVKLNSLAYCRACITPGLFLLLCYGVEVMPCSQLCGLQLLLQLLHLSFSLADCLAGIPQGALYLANALLQLLVPPLHRSQALLHSAASLLFLEQCSLHWGAHQLERGNSKLTNANVCFFNKENQNVANQNVANHQVVVSCGRTGDVIFPSQLKHCLCMSVKHKYVNPWTSPTMQRSCTLMFQGP